MRMSPAGRIQQSDEITDLGAGLSVAIPFPGSEQFRSALIFPSTVSYSKSCSPTARWCYETLHITPTAAPCSACWLEQLTSLLGFWDKGDLPTQAFQPIAQMPHVTSVGGQV